MIPTKIDRNLQFDILRYLESIYHESSAITDTWDVLLSFASQDERKLIANMRYLEEHGLLISGIDDGTDSEMISESAIKITAKGIDFIAGDGGLDAILRTITVKIHDDSLTRLEQFLSHHPDLSEQDKTGYIARLRSLPADATKHLLLKLLDLGLTHSPDALRLIQSLLGMG